MTFLAQFAAMDANTAGLRMRKKKTGNKETDSQRWGMKKQREEIRWTGEKKKNAVMYYCWSCFFFFSFLPLFIKSYSTAGRPHVAVSPSRLLATLFFPVCLIYQLRPKIRLLLKKKKRGKSSWSFVRSLLRSTCFRSRYRAPSNLKYRSIFLETTGKGFLEFYDSGRKR